MTDRVCVPVAGSLEFQGDGLQPWKWDFRFAVPPGFVMKIV